MDNRLGIVVDKIAVEIKKGLTPIDAINKVCDEIGLSKYSKIYPYLLSRFETSENITNLFKDNSKQPFRKVQKKKQPIKEHSMRRNYRRFPLHESEDREFDNLSDDQVYALESCESGTLYDFVANNYWKMSKEVLKDIALEAIYSADSDSEIGEELKDRWL